MEITGSRIEQSLVAGVTALRYIAIKLGGILSGQSRREIPTYTELGKPFFRFLELLIRNHHDDCRCACSSHRCTPIIVILKTFTYRKLWKTELVNAEMRPKLRRRIAWFLELLHGVRSLPLKTSQLVDPRTGNVPHVLYP
jgi:hypothetical protein